MRQLLVIVGISLLFLTACDDSVVGISNDELEQEVEQAQAENEDLVDEADGTVKNEDTNPDTIENETSKDNTSVKEENVKEEESKKVEKSDVKDVAQEIIWAQVNHNYDYLRSVVGDGVRIDQTNNTITFNTSEATHTFDFLTGIKEEDLEFRFVEGDETERAIVGFAAIDYENEYSYVIEMILQDVNGSWKLVSMDINK